MCRETETGLGHCSYTVVPMDLAMQDDFFGGWEILVSLQYLEKEVASCMEMCY